MSNDVKRSNNYSKIEKEAKHLETSNHETMDYPTIPHPMMKILNPEPMVRLIDEEEPQPVKGCAINSGPMVKFEEGFEPPQCQFTNSSSNSQPMVRFETGFEPTPLIKQESDSNRSYHKESKQELKKSEPGLKLPAVANSKFNLITDNKLKIYNKSKEVLKMRGEALHKIENFYNGTDYSFDNGFVLNKLGEKICNFILFIICEIIIYTETKAGYSTRSQYKIEIYVNGATFEGYVYGDELYNLSWLRKISNGKAHIFAAGKKGSNFADILSELISKSEYPVHHYYPASGWYDISGIGYCYLYDKGIIGINQSDYSADNEHKLIYNENLLGSQVIFNDILRMMTKVCNNPDISTVITLYSHIGVLTTLFDRAKFPVKFIVALIGVTNSKKTSLALNFTKLFDRCAAPKPEMAFTATDCGIETIFSRYHDAVFIVDDLKPSESREMKRSMAKKLESIIRAYGDRVPKARMLAFTSNGKDVYYPINGCCMITGEYLDGVASSLARIVKINIEKNDVIDKELSYFQEDYMILSTHMVDFISYITDNFDNVVFYINSRIKQIRSTIGNKFSMARYAESYATFIVCAEIFINYAKSRNFLSDSEAEYYLNQFEVSIYSIISSSDSSTHENNPGIIALQAIDTYISNGIIEVNHEGHNPEQGDKYYAYMQDNFLCIRLQTVYQIMLKYLRSFNKESSLTDYMQLLPFLKGLDVIYIKQEGSESRSTHKLRNRTSNTRYLFINRSKMAKILENENLY